MMKIQAALKGQFHAALAMLKQAVENCPADLWDRDEAGPPFWHVAYHTLFLRTCICAVATAPGTQYWSGIHIRPNPRLLVFFRYDDRCGGGPIEPRFPGKRVSLV